MKNPQPLLIWLIIFMFSCSYFAGAFSGTDVLTSPGNVNSIQAEGSIWTYPGYASNVPGMSNISGSDYTLCSLGGSTTDSLIYDLNFDGSQELVIGQTNLFSIFNLNCELIQQIYIGGTLMRPQLSKVIGGTIYYPEIILANATRMYIYSYNISNGQMGLNTTLNTSITKIQDIICNANPYTADFTTGLFGDLTCVIFTEDSKNTYLLNTVTRHITNNSAALGYYGYEGHSTYKTYALSYTGLPIGPFFGYLPYCSVSGINTGCEILDEHGTLRFEANPPAPSNAGSPSDQNAFIAKLGTQFRLFRSGNFDVTSTFWYGFAYIGDISSNTVYAYPGPSYNYFGGIQFGTARPFVSQWSVGDWNKDGQNEACIIGNFSSGTNFTCFDGTFTRIININVTGVINVNNFIMADFDHSAATLGIGTPEGIFYYDGGSDFDQWYSTGYNGNQYKGSVEPFGHDSPAYVVRTSTNSYIVKPSSNIVFCGDDDCSEGYENGLSCPADCFDTLSTEGEFVGNNGTLCRSGYTQYGYCRQAPEGHACYDGQYCLSGTCSNGVCTKPNWLESLNEAKKQAGADDLGSSTLLSLIICLALMAGTGILLGQVVKDSPFPAIAALFVFILTFTFFGLIGWVYPFLMIGMWFLIAVIGFVAVYFSPGG